MPDMTLLPEPLAEYVYEHTTPEADPFVRLREETHAALAMPQMQVGRVEGAFLRMMVQLTGAQRVLEVGTYSGYSAMAMASGLPEHGKLITCDIDPVATAMAQRHWADSPWGAKIELRLGDARETLRELARAGEHFDLLFLDADKENYVEYYELALPMLPIGGLVLADNTLWSGRVLAPSTSSDHGIVRFNAHVRADPRVEQVLLAVRDGIMMARKRSD